MLAVTKGLTAIALSGVLVAAGGPLPRAAAAPLAVPRISAASPDLASWTAHVLPTSNPAAEAYLTGVSDSWAVGIDQGVTSVGVYWDLQAASPVVTALPLGATGWEARPAGVSGDWAAGTLLDKSGVNHAAVWNLATKGDPVLLADADPSPTAQSGVVAMGGTKAVGNTGSGISVWDVTAPASTPQILTGVGTSLVYGAGPNGVATGYTTSASWRMQATLWFYDTPTVPVILKGMYGSTSYDTAAKDSSTTAAVGWALDAVGLHPVAWAQTDGAPAIPLPEDGGTAGVANAIDGAIAVGYETFLGQKQAVAWDLSDPADPIFHLALPAGATWAEARVAGDGVIGGHAAMAAVVPVVWMAPVATPPTAVIDAPASPSSASPLVFDVTFSESVSGLESGDFSASGSGCVIGIPGGSGAAYQVEVTGCADGDVILTLGAGTVADVDGTAGPEADVTAATVTVDRTAPVPAQPLVSIPNGVALPGTAIPVRIPLSASGGAISYLVERSVDDGAWTQLAPAVTGTTFATTAAAGHRVAFRISARDGAGNLSDPAVSATRFYALTQQVAAAVTWAGAWRSVASAAYSGGSARYASTAGATATYRFTGRSIAIVTTRASTRGKVRVLIDGVAAATVDLRGTTLYRAIVWQKSWSASGTHTIRLVVLGTVGRPRVDVDAFVVLK